MLLSPVSCLRLRRVLAPPILSRREEENNKTTLVSHRRVGQQETRGKRKLNQVRDIGLGISWNVENPEYLLRDPGRRESTVPYKATTTHDRNGERAEFIWLCYVCSALRLLAARGEVCPTYSRIATP